MPDLKQCSKCKIPKAPDQYKIRTDTKKPSKMCKTCCNETNKNCYHKTTKYQRVAKKRNEIDLRLSVICTVLKHGQTLSFSDIADVCGCNQSLIQKIQSQALKKLQNNAQLQQHQWDAQ